VARRAICHSVEDGAGYASFARERPINNRPAGYQPAPQQMAKVQAGLRPRVFFAFGGPQGHGALPYGRGSVTRSRLGSSFAG
jgi:hypothetical protein